jgi:hypothetical protein
MRVKDLRKALADMPGEMNVYFRDGTGVKSVMHLVGMNLVGMEQCCEVISYLEEHTPDLLDSKIERETGFKDRDELISAYKALLSKPEDVAK